MPATPQTHDLLDKAIALGVMFFILSMISERLVTWIKLQFGKKGKSLIFFSDVEEDLTIKTNDPEIEKKRERRILGLNIVVGIIIALISHADFFAILNNSDSPYNAIGWSNVHIENGWDFLFLLLGSILTGFFISLGSKFWHDLLDMLFYAKNLKQKLADPKTYEATSADQLTEYLNFSESDLVRLAIEQNGQILKTKFPNIHYLNDSVALINGERKDVLGIYVRDKNTTGIPDQVPVKLPSGKTYSVTTEIISGIGKIKVTGGMDGSVENSNFLGYSGSGCCIVADAAKNYLLTNCHVMTDGYLKNPISNTGQPDVNYNDDKIGSWSYGSMTTLGDFALAEIENIDDFISNNNPEIFNDQKRILVKDDWLKLQVTVRGNKCKTRTGAYIIEVVQNQVQIEYKLGDILTLSQAILIADNPSKTNCNPVTNEGDSGGAVYDADNKMIGIMVSKDNNFSYAIPLNDFLANLNLKIK